MDDNPISSPEANVRALHQLGDSLAMLAFPAAFLMWAFIPTFGLRIVAVALAIISVIYLSHRAVWAPQQRWKRHLLAVLATIVILLVGMIQLQKQWKEEHPAPAPQAKAIPSATALGLGLGKQSQEVVQKATTQKPKIALSPIVKPGPATNPPAPITNNCPNGICISGGTVDHPTVNNNLSEPFPHILGLEFLDSSNPKYHLPVEQAKPTVTFRFYTDTSWNDPQFVVVCDRPCYASNMTPQNAGVVTTPNYRTITSGGNPNTAVFLPIQDRPFPEGVYFIFQVASKDEKPIKVLQVIPAKLNLMPQQ